MPKVRRSMPRRTRYTYFILLPGARPLLRFLDQEPGESISEHKCHDRWKVEAVLAIPGGR